MTVASATDRLETDQAYRILAALTVIDGLCVIFHLLFPVLFDWKNELAKLNASNHGIFICLHYCATYMLLMFTIGTASLGLAAKKGAEFGRFERSVLASIGGFFVLRAILEIPAFGVSAMNFVMIAICGAIGAAYIKLAKG